MGGTPSKKKSKSGLALGIRSNLNDARASCFQDITVGLNVRSPALPLIQATYRDHPAWFVTTDRGETCVFTAIFSSCLKNCCELNSDALQVMQFISEIIRSKNSREFSFNTIVANFRAMQDHFGNREVLKSLLSYKNYQVYQNIITILDFLALLKENKYVVSQKEIVQLPTYVGLHCKNMKPELFEKLGELFEVLITGKSFSPSLFFSLELIYIYRY
jgi:hypothetical protein